MIMPDAAAALSLQGPSAAPLFNYLLQQAAAASQFDAVVDVLAAMRGGGLEVESEVVNVVRCAVACSPHAHLLLCWPASKLEIGCIPA